jgi:enamine deaminase RidA (YjgF/YER057c/UK114 family)
MVEALEFGGAQMRIVGSEGTGRSAGRFHTYGGIADGLVFTTGGRGYTPESFDPTKESGILPDSFDDEVRCALGRQVQVLEQAGTDASHLIKVNIVVNTSDQDEADRVGSLYNQFMRDRGVEGDLPPVRIIQGTLAIGRIAVDVVATEDSSPVTIKSADLLPLPFVQLSAHSDSGVSTSHEAVASCLENLRNALRKLGCDIPDLVKVSTYLPLDLVTVEGYAQYGKIYRDFFDAHGGGDKRPPRASCGVAAPQPYVQMDVVALTSK